MRFGWMARLVVMLVFCCAAVMPGLAQSPAQTQDQRSMHAQSRTQPIITGTRTTSMDAPENNSDLEHYAHSAVVQAMARHMGMSTVAAARLFEDINSGVLIAAILFFILKYVPGIFRGQRRTIEHDLVEARKATADAEMRLKAIEARLAGLNGEVDALRKRALENNQAEESRMRASLEAERERIVHSAEADIHAAQAAAERGLRRYASDLAVDRAAERVRLNEDGDRVLVDEFLQNLAGTLGRRGQN